VKKKEKRKDNKKTNTKGGKAIKNRNIKKVNKKKKLT
jgi:hypothetical protein